MAFVKVEKLTSEGDPRIIQPTSDEYLAALAPLIKTIDKILVDSHYEFTRGLNYEQLGDRFTREVARYGDPVVISIDYSRFDGHVGKKLLKCEHLTYVWGTGDKELAKLVAWQLETVGKTRSGLRYKREGGRCSGHPNTSCGNGILNLLMIRTVLMLSKTPASVFVNGDDCIVLMERAGSQLWKGASFNLFGMEAEVSQTEVDFAEYCSGRFMPIGDRRYTFVRDLPKALLKLPWALGRLNAKTAKARRHDVCHALLSQCTNVPLFTSLCKYWHDRQPCRKVNRRFISWSLSDLDLSLKDLSEPCQTSREWFERVYGLNPIQQEQAEREISERGWHPFLTRLARTAFSPAESPASTHGSKTNDRLANTYARTPDDVCEHKNDTRCDLHCCKAVGSGEDWSLMRLDQRLPCEDPPKSKPPTKAAVKAYKTFVGSLNLDNLEAYTNWWHRDHAGGYEGWASEAQTAYEEAAEDGRRVFPKEESADPRPQEGESVPEEGDDSEGSECATEATEECPSSESCPESSDSGREGSGYTTDSDHVESEADE